MKTIKQLNDFCLEHKKAIVYNKQKIVKGFIPNSLFYNHKLRMYIFTSPKGAREVI